MHTDTPHIPYDVLGSRLFFILPFSHHNLFRQISKRWIFNPMSSLNLFGLHHELARRIGIFHKEDLTKFIATQTQFFIVQRVIAHIFLH